MVSCKRVYLIPCSGVAYAGIAWYHWWGACVAYRNFDGKISKACLLWPSSDLLVQRSVF